MGKGLEIVLGGDPASHKIFNEKSWTDVSLSVERLMLERHVPRRQDFFFFSFFFCFAPFLGLKVAVFIV